MIRTPICDLLNIQHPIALGGMGSASSPAMTAAVSRAGGLGAMGCHRMRLVDSFSQQLQGRLQVLRRDPGTEFLLKLPLKPRG
jgi:NAD(P)H-dependent flavin oxidoreductase YrpB (nitropropane dioxygenase family)